MFEDSVQTYIKLSSSVEKQLSQAEDSLPPSLLTTPSMPKQQGDSLHFYKSGKGQVLLLVQKRG